jgi:hypothetical protein
MAGAALPKLFPFVFFGCWNQPGAEGVGSVLPRDKVFEAVASMDDIKAIVIGGDNVYPRPLPGDVKNKKHEIDVFMEGINKYLSLKKLIIPTFGNHNVVDKDVLNKQKEVFDVDKTYNSYKFAGGVHILVLDTNIIIDDPDKPAYSAMLDWFRSNVDALPVDHKYYVVQHDPYFTARKKGIGGLINADPFLEIMFARPPIAVLCADTHHYQYATIQPVGAADDPRHTLHQFTVGTGGANYDIHRAGFKTQIMEEKYIYTQINIVEGFGFLRISGADPAAFDFIHVANWSGGGRRRQSRHRRRSYAEIRSSRKRRTRRNSR